MLGYIIYSSEIVPQIVAWNAFQGKKFYFHGFEKVSKIEESFMISF